MATSKKNALKKHATPKKTAASTRQVFSGIKFIISECCPIDTSVKLDPPIDVAVARNGQTLRIAPTQNGTASILSFPTTEKLKLDFGNVVITRSLGKAVKFVVKNGTLRIVSAD